jgi:hypothetical protein
MNIGIQKKSSHLHNSVIFRRSATMFIPACSGEKCVIIVWVSAIAGALKQEYHILSGHRFPQRLTFHCDCLHGAHNHLGPEAQ